MKRCPECKTRTGKSADYCAACFYHFKPEDAVRAAYESHRRKARICSVVAGLCVAIFRYALLG